MNNSYKTKTIELLIMKAGMKGSMIKKTKNMNPLYVACVLCKICDQDIDCSHSLVTV